MDVSGKSEASTSEKRSDQTMNGITYGAIGTTGPIEKGDGRFTSLSTFTLSEDSHDEFERSGATRHWIQA